MGRNLHDPDAKLVDGCMAADLIEDHTCYTYFIQFERNTNLEYYVCYTYYKMGSVSRRPSFAAADLEFLVTCFPPARTIIYRVFEGPLVNV
jgi:hypothetical protein